MPIFKSTAIIRTPNGARFMKRLLTHFAHKISVSHTDTQGRADFPFGVCLMQVKEGSFILKAESDSVESLKRVQDVLDIHLVKFARDEPIEINWV